MPVLTDNEPAVTAHNYFHYLFWTGDFIKFNALKAKKDKGKKTDTSASEKISCNTLILAAPSHVIKPISGVLVRASDLSTADGHDLSLRGLTKTWWFDVGHLKDIVKSIWDKVTANKWKVVETGICFNEAFPYGGLSGMRLLIIL